MEHDDVWNPNTWSCIQPSYRIYGDTEAYLFAEVDEEDYFWAIAWLWSSKRSRGKKGKTYICRQLTQRVNGARFNSTLMLHIEIMKRTGIMPPTPEHTFVDHRDGDELNCRRSNLRWVTPSMNRKNLYGSCSYDLLEEVCV